MVKSESIETIEGYMLKDKSKLSEPVKKLEVRFWKDTKPKFPASDNVNTLLILVKISEKFKFTSNRVLIVADFA